MADIYGELIGCDELHYALITADTVDAYTPGVLKYLAPAAEISHETKVDVAKRYYDNQLRFVTVSEGDTEVKITISGVPCVLAAELTGKPYDAAKGIFIDTGDASNTPWAALSGRMDLGDGGYRYFSYLKGKYSLGSQKAKTREDKTTVNTTDLTYSAVVTNKKFTMPDASTRGVKGVFADTTDAAFDPSSWFTQVQTPATVTPVSAIALSSSTPADEDTGVSATVSPSLTFNNIIASEAVTLVKDSDNTVVSATKTWDSAHKVLTIDPAASLTSAAVYNIIVAGVVDIFGQALTPTVINFTVA